MTSRLHSMCAILNAKLLTRDSYADIKSNSLSLRILQLLRERGLIFGFSYSFITHKTHKGRPNIRVYLKVNAIKQITLTKNTRSNWSCIEKNRKESVQTLLLYSSIKGLRLSSLSDSYLAKPTGKLLGRLII